MEIRYQLAKRFREVILDGVFIANTNYKDQLESLDWKSACKQIGSANSIAMLAQHVHYYIEGIKDVLNGGALTVSDAESFDFPVIISNDEWTNFLNKLWKDATEFAGLVEKMPEDKLYDVFVEEKYGTYLRNIESMIEHAYYHLGQIVLLKKYFV
jgi:hypothetical protein